MSMDFENSKELFIQGVTLDGKTFRPSDWAERLAVHMRSKALRTYCHADLGLDVHSRRAPASTS